MIFQKENGYNLLLGHEFQNEYNKKKDEIAIKSTSKCK